MALLSILYLGGIINICGAQGISEYGTPDIAYLIASIYQETNLIIGGTMSFDT
jgi:hypothetical protein